MLVPGCSDSLLNDVPSRIESRHHQFTGGARIGPFKPSPVQGQQVGVAPVAAANTHKRRWSGPPVAS